MTMKKMSRRKYTTRTRMTRTRLTRRRRISNRGGAPLARLRQQIYHNFIPLVTKYNNLYTGEQLHPNNKSVVRHGDRYFNITERVIDPEIKYSIKEALDELEDPVKTADKLKTVYDKFKQAEDEKKRKATINRTHLPPASLRSFSDVIRSPMQFSHIPKELIYHKPGYDHLHRTPENPQGGNDENGEGEGEEAAAGGRRTYTERQQNHEAATMMMMKNTKTAMTLKRNYYIQEKKKNQHHDYLWFHQH
jgi:hypothetical protein